VIKDLLKTMLEINNDTNIKPSEKVLLSSLILYHSHADGYSYPNYEHLQVALSTNRKATVSNTLKSLEEKQYITIKKSKGNKNLYFIHKYLFYVGENTSHQEKPVDSNGKKPLENQVHIDEVLPKEDSKVIEISNYTGFNRKESAELLEESGRNTAKIIKAFDYMKSKGKVDNEFKYTKWAINNENKLNIGIQNPNYESGKKAPKFNNFEGRQYDYEALEKRLLGWADDEEPKSLSEYMINN
jgi:hypothetical protein